MILEHAQVSRLLILIIAIIGESGQNVRGVAVEDPGIADLESQGVCITDAQSTAARSNSPSPEPPKALPK